MKKIIILMAAVFALTACDKKPKSIDYYSYHIGEARDVFNNCKSKGNDTVDCRNAKIAVTAVDAGKKQLKLCKWTNGVSGAKPWVELMPPIQEVLVDFVYQGFTKGPKPMLAGSNNNKQELIDYIKNTHAISQYDPGRHKANYLEASLALSFPISVLGHFIPA